MADEVKHLDVREFVEVGYLQEVNRTFFHPLGLALEVGVTPGGEHYLSGVWDCRDDDEGVLYAAKDGTPRTPSSEKAMRVKGEFARRAPRRLAALGFVVQPIDAPERAPDIEVTRG